ncbi:MAG: hypothetical protein ACJ0G8_03810 [Dehalococcoidia bacterium]
MGKNINSILPNLIMGLHPFDGVSYKNEKIDKKNLDLFQTTSSVSKVYEYVIKKYNLSMAQIDHMNPVLNRQHIQALQEAEKKTKKIINLLAYLLIPIKYENKIISYSKRSHATLYDADINHIGYEKYTNKIYKDEILKYNLDGDYNNLITNENTKPYSQKESEKFTIDYNLLEQYIGFFAGCDILIADPGAEIDLLAITGRFDLIKEYINFLRKKFKIVITSVHHAGITIPLLEENNIDVDGYLTPTNKLGMMMFPNKETAEFAVRNTNKTIIGMKPLAGGRFLGEQAFEYVFDKLKINSCMFGMGTIEQTDSTIKSALNVIK